MALKFHIKLNIHCEVIFDMKKDHLLSCFQYYFLSHFYLKNINRKVVFHIENSALKKL
jgi:hypothetical protein